MSETFVPVLYTCVVELDLVEEKTAGGIIRPDTERAQAAMTRATVLAVGPLAFSESKEGDITPKAGDRVVVNKYPGQFLKGPDDTMRIVNDRDILCIIEEAG